MTFAGNGFNWPVKITHIPSKFKILPVYGVYVSMFMGAKLERGLENRGRDLKEMRNRASNEWNILESRMEEELGKGEAAGGGREA